MSDSFVTQYQGSLMPTGASLHDHLLQNTENIRVITANTANDRVTDGFFVLDRILRWIIENCLPPHQFGPCLNAQPSESRFGFRWCVVFDAARAFDPLPPAGIGHRHIFGKSNAECSSENACRGRITHQSKSVCFSGGSWLNTSSVASGSLSWLHRV